MASEDRNRLDDLRRAAETFQETAERARRAGPAAGAGYSLIGAILLLGGIGYAIDAWRGTSPWGLLIGLLLGIVVGMYELREDRVHETQRVMTRPVAWMLGAGLVCWVGATVMFGAEAHLATLLGTIGPLAVAVVTWRLAEQTYRQNPSALTGLMMGGFVAKMVLFGVYVVVVIKGFSQPAVPFAVSFAASFIAVYVIEALALKRLFAE